MIDGLNDDNNYIHNNREFRDDIIQFDTPGDSIYDPESKKIFNNIEHYNKYIERKKKLKCIINLNI